jgi:outer membrane protein TolC
LGRLVDVYVRQYQVGMGTSEAVVGAQTELLHAQLDAAERPAERVALLTEHEKRVADFLKLTEGRFSTGTATQADVYRAKSLLLDAKIKLLRERNRPGVR